MVRTKGGKGFEDVRRYRAHGSEVNQNEVGTVRLREKKMVCDVMVVRVLPLASSLKRKMKGERPLVTHSSFISTAELWPTCPKF